MADKSAIEWTDATWNPVTGCSKVSPGCANCYAETLSLRFGWSKKPWTPENAAENVVLHPERLDVPLKWRKPRMVFVNSMSDLFHEEVPDDFIHRVFAVMALARRHTFQVLTKRPERARALMRDLTFARGSFTWMIEHHVGDYAPDFEVTWPLPNVWLGVSIENARYTWRADVLREIPAAVRFISAEPLLGSLYPKGDRDADLGREDRLGHVLMPGERDQDLLEEGEATTVRLGAANGPEREPGDHHVAARRLDLDPDLRRRQHRDSLDLTGIDWVIVGGESGPGARPLHPDWAREIRDACLTFGSESGFPETRPAFFLKQWGEWAPVVGHLDRKTNLHVLDGHARPEPWTGYQHGAITRWGEIARDGRGNVIVQKLGKKRAGRELDGRTWDEMPAKERER